MCVCLEAGVSGEDTEIVYVCVCLLFTTLLMRKAGQDERAKTVYTH